MKLDPRILKQYERIKNKYPSADPQRAYHRHAHLLKVITKYSSPGDLLDIGAGWAVESRVLMDLGFKITVLDFTGANSGFSGRFDGQPINVVDANVELGIPIPDDSFDTVLFLDIIEHLRDSPKPVLKEIMRVLRPGGVVVCATPNVVELRKRIYMMMAHSFAPSLDYVWNTTYHADHHREYTPEEARWVFAEAGFNILQHGLVDTFWPMPLQSFEGRGVGKKAENKSTFEPSGRWYRPYDVIKQFPRAIVKLRPRFRDLIITVASKPINETEEN